MSRPPTRPCQHCAEPIVFAITAAGRRQPLNPDPDPAGNVAVLRDATGTLRARVPSPDLPLMGYERLHMPHAATCTRTRRRPAASPSLPAGVVDLATYRTRRKARR